VIETGEGPLSLDQRRVIGEALRDNQVVAFPTSSSYGLAVDPFSMIAVGRLLELKRDRGQNPIALIIDSIDRLGRVIDQPPALLRELGARLWPGPLTLIGRAGSGLDPGITGGGETVGVRVPGHPTAREVATLAGGVATATSANPTGSPPASTAEEVSAYFDGAVAVVIDAGATTAGLPSTVVDLLSDPPAILRAGGVDPGLVIRAMDEIRRRNAS